MIWVETDGLIDIDGSLVANGGNGGYRAGGGSGGGVLLSCRKLTGTGVIEAKGGDGGNSNEEEEEAESPSGRTPFGRIRRMSQPMQMRRHPSSILLA